MIILKKARILGRLGSRAYLPGSRLSKVLYLGCGLLQQAGRMASLGLTAGSRSRRSVWLAQQTRVLCVLFFLSGFPALIYQLTWQRALFLIFGVNIESVTIVVTAFMLGLGFGSLAGGWLSKRQAIPLLPLLAIIELLTGAFGVVSLAIFDHVGALTAGWPLPATAAINLSLVIVPTLLMGATLPVLVSHLVRRSGNVGGAVGLLYYVNTLGAGAACLASTVLFFPFLGMQGSVYVAVAVNAAVATGARPRGGARACCRRRLRLAVLRDLFLPRGLLCIGLERDRVRRDPVRIPRGAGFGIAPGRRELRGLVARGGDAAGGERLA